MEYMGFKYHDHLTRNEKILTVAMAYPITVEVWVMIFCVW